MTIGANFNRQGLEKEDGKTNNFNFSQCPESMVERTFGLPISKFSLEKPAPLGAGFSHQHHAYTHVLLAAVVGGAERAPSPTDSKNISQIQIYTALRYNFFTLTNTLSSHILHLSSSFLAKPTRTTQLKFPHGNAIGGQPPPWA